MKTVFVSILTLISLYVSGLSVRQKQKNEECLIGHKCVLWIEDLILPQSELDCSQRNLYSLKTTCSNKQCYFAVPKHTIKTKILMLSRVEHSFYSLSLSLTVYVSNLEVTIKTLQEEKYTSL